MAFGAFYLRDTAGSPERARSLHLARSGSQSQHVIWFILPAHGASHIINEAYMCEQHVLSYLFLKVQLNILIKQSSIIEKNCNIFIF